jgi:outer membrane protein assembly factor BamB
MKLWMLAFIALSAVACRTREPLVITTRGTELLIPEGIAVDAAGRIYVSSINLHKIIVIEKDGSHRDFIPAGHDKYLEGLGMKIDGKRNWLWALSNIQQGKTYTSQVHAFDLETGKTQQYHVLRDTVPHLFNDLVIGNDGRIFLTDTYYSAVYSLDPEARKLELVVKSKLLDYPNGLVEGKYGKLYVATYEHGPMMLDLATKELKPLGGFRDSAIAFALDGLNVWNNTLTGVYNYNPAGDRSTNAVVQYVLVEDGTAIAEERIIDRGNALFYEPTTAAVAGDYLYVIANSHLATYNANKQSVKGVENKLKPVTVIRYRLKD